MKMRLSKINNSEWGLSKYNEHGKAITFFILKQKDNRYYTAQTQQFEQIKEEIKNWLLEEAIPEFFSVRLGSLRTDMDFDYGIITSIFRDKKLKDLDI
jgi:hypothetical protein